MQNFFKYFFKEKYFSERKFRERVIRKFSADAFFSQPKIEDVVQGERKDDDDTASWRRSAPTSADYRKVIPLVQSAQTDFLYKKGADSSR